MKLGYSLLLLDHVSAEAVGYEDCKAFQIVCPACKEPVFKVVRTAEDATLDYLSHYASARSYAADCELRVTSMLSDEIKKKDAAGRGQRLAYFLSVLRAALSADQRVYNNPFEAERRQKGLRRHKGLLPLIDLVLAGQKLPGFRSGFEEIARDYIIDQRQVCPGQDDNEVLLLDQTSFGTSVQIRIAQEITFHLHSGVARPNFEHLFRHGLAALQARLAHGTEGTAVEKAIHSALAEGVRRITSGNRRSQLAALGDLMRTELPEQRTVSGPPLPAGGTLLIKLMAEISHEMVGALLRLPYARLLRDAQAGIGQR